MKCFRIYVFRAVVATVLFLELGLTAAAGVRLPSVISDGMLIQRGEPFTVWGWAEPGERFGVCWQEACHPVEAGEDGRWQLELPQAPAAMS